MKRESKDVEGQTLRYAMLLPLFLMIASLVTCCQSYSSARQNLADDLNEAMIALANKNSALWTRQDTIAAIRKMHEITHEPIIYQASDVNFKNPVLKNEAYFTIALVDRKNAAPKGRGNKIASDSIMLVPEHSADGLAIQVQAYADCSMASVFAASDQTVPGVLFMLSILSVLSMFVLRRKEMEIPETELASEIPAIHPLDGIKLTPMQRQFAQMLLDAPDMRVEKNALCASLWGNKSNAEESLYTLVRRTKKALASANIEIICNRGDSYQLRISD